MTKDLRTFLSEIKKSKDLMVIKKKASTKYEIAALTAHAEGGKALLFENIKDFDDEKYNFKGFIDLVLQTDDGKYHIIDWKTCSWGWKSEKKSDRLTTYQLTLYKKFFCQSIRDYKND